MTELLGEGCIEDVEGDVRDMQVNEWKWEKVRMRRCCCLYSKDRFSRDGRASVSSQRPRLLVSEHDIFSNVLV